MKKIQIEVCCYSVESAIIAQQAGANRVELCGGIFEGGTTPSAGCIKLTRENIDINLYVIIRPRGGDFCYSDIEFETMKQDIKIAKESGVNGVVIGLLKEDGAIDKIRTKHLIDLASPMSITFHRAFDMTSDSFRALDDLIDLKIDRILTSGQEQTALQGKELISKLVKQSKNKIKIMAGSGINESNIQELITATNADEYHLSGKIAIPGKMKYRNIKINMGRISGIPEYEIIKTDQRKIETIVQICKNMKD